MTPIPARFRARSPLAAALALLAAALLLGALPGPAAHAAERTVAGGRLDWGIRSSFLGYVTGPVAQGSWSLSGGAGTVGSDRFRFHSARGGYDPETGAVHARYSGGVRFQGHRDAAGGYELDLTVSDPAVEISGGRGTLRADVRSRDRETGAVVEHTAVALATLDLTGVELRGGTRVAVSGVPATLTAEGAAAFAGFYGPGDPLDPVTFTADSREPEPEPEAEPEPAPASSGAAPEPEETTGPAEGPVPIADAAVDWGVRRTFREFVTGEIAAGGWRLTDGAADGGALFRFGRGEGDYDAEEGTLAVAFAGRLHFTGNDLDLLLSGVTVEVTGHTGTLAADVTSGGTTAAARPLVTFEVPELAPEGGLLLVTEAPAELTEAGADAFGGRYPAGTAMDPVSLAVALDETAELPPLPDLGSEPPAGEEDAGPEGGAEPVASADPESAPAASSSAPALLLTGGIAVLALAAAGRLVLRRTRAARTASPPGSPPAAAERAEPEQPAADRKAGDRKTSGGSGEPAAPAPATGTTRTTGPVGPADPTIEETPDHDRH